MPGGTAGFSAPRECPKVPNLSPPASQLSIALPPLRVVPAVSTSRTCSRVPPCRITRIASATFVLDTPVFALKNKSCSHLRCITRSMPGALIASKPASSKRYMSVNRKCSMVLAAPIAFRSMVMGTPLPDRKSSPALPVVIT